MRTVRTAGFTLVELLVVIAIIGILFGFTAVAVPRVLERAKIAQTTSTAAQIRTILSAYYTDHGSYPPRYGSVRQWIDGQPTYFLRPYLHQLGIYSIDGYQDPFSTSHDTAGPFGTANRNPDGSVFPIGILEFFPIGTPLPGAPGQRQYPDDDLYLGVQGGGPAAQDAERQLGEFQRAFVYLPINQRQFDFVKAYYQSSGPITPDRAFARVWDPADPRLQQVAAFPPPRYDAFVLLSVGPGGETGGVLVDPLPTEPLPTVYHTSTLRAYYLATRDINGNGQKDFDFLARSRQNEARDIENTPGLGTQYALLPDAYERLVGGEPNPPMRYGPMIFAY